MDAAKGTPAKLKGPQKAAIFLLAMGEEFASSFFKKLDEPSIKEIGKYMSEINTIPSEVLNGVIEEFLGNFASDRTLHVSGKSFLEQVISKSLDGGRAREICKSIGQEVKRTPFDDLSVVPGEKLFNILKGEHPQTVALIISYLPESKGAEILGLFPEEIRSEIALRIARIGPVEDDVVRELDEVIRKDLTTLGGPARQLDGVEKLAAILNELDGKSEEAILSSIEGEDNDLAERIRKRMFVFEDLLQVDDKGFREILQNVDKSTLAKALKTASEEMKTKIFSNLSERAAEMLREDLEVLGPVRLKEVEESQQTILKAAKKLETEGRVAFAGKNKEDVFV
jgi:flagellar motor switch protein FliG